MSYTLLSAVAAGIVLYDEHRMRLAPAGGPIADQFEAFARAAEPGVYALRTEGERLAVERRPKSRLFDGMPVRWSPSPFAGLQGAFSKPASPSPYDALRIPGVSTLLTSPDGEEIYESCSAAVVEWDDARLVLAPADRPRVASTAERALRERVEFVEEPLLRRATRPLALVNAVKGICLPAIPGREPFPAAARDLVEAALASTVRRP